MLRGIFKFLASLKLALLLMAVIIAAAAIGTWYESRFNADVAQKYIYGHWWFNIWLFMLCVNLFCVAAIRYPWKPHQTGFVITHAGIITLLIGGMIDRIWGIEGYLQLFRGAQPAESMELHEQKVDVHTSDSDRTATTSFRVKSIIRPSDRQFALKSPSPAVQVEVRDVAPVSQVDELVPSESGGPALSVTLQGPMMGRNDESLFINQPVNLGMASLAFVSGVPEVQSPKPKIQEAQQPEAAEKEKMVPRLERYFIFSKYADSPIIRTLNGERTRASARLLVDDGGEKPQLQLELLGKTFAIPVKDHEHDPAPMPLEGLPEWSLKIVGYYPNLKMKDGKPVSDGDKPENPGLCFELNGPLAKPGEVAEQVSPHGGASGDAAAPGDGPANGLTIYLSADNKLRYQIKSRRNGLKSGEVRLETPVALGWAPGTEFIVHELVLKAIPRAVWKPLPEKTARGEGMENENRGLLCRVTAGGESKEIWVGQSMGRGMNMESVEVGGKRVDIVFANKVVPLPFAVALKKFNAPYQEGLEGSTNFMSFESTLSFDEKEDTVWLNPESKLVKEQEARVLTGAITDVSDASLTLELDTRQTLTVPMAEVSRYEKLTHKISMNVPTTYPETWYGPWLGTGYKFSQANHDMPRNPDYSGVQVLRDPGWMPKWVGSLMICFGIFTMFYLKPYFKRAPATPKAADVKTIAAAVDGKKGKQAVAVTRS